MESKEKCEQIIQMFNGKALQGAKDALLVKFADGGNKKKSLYKSTIWRETGDVSLIATFSYLNFQPPRRTVKQITIFFQIDLEHDIELRSKRRRPKRCTDSSYAPHCDYRSVQSPLRSSSSGL